MKITVSGALVQLQGDWTIKGLTRYSMDSMATALQQIMPDRTKTLPIDCRQVTAIDTVGKEVLSGWMDIVRLRGIEPKLMNTPDGLVLKDKKSGFDTFG